MHLNRNTDIPDRYRDRKLPLKIKRGFKDVDEVEIKLPSRFQVESCHTITFQLKINLADIKLKLL